MTIIVFLIDTSASMNQRAYLGGRPTLLDVAKGAVETFVKVREYILRRIMFAKFVTLFIRKYKKKVLNCFYLLHRFAKDPLKAEVTGTCY